MNDFETIKQQFPLDQFITRVTGKNLKPAGSALSMDPCPFCGHNDCFRVWKRINAFKCYSGNCGESGNIFNFSKAIHNIHDDFQNLKKVAEICDYKITNSKGIEQESPGHLIKQKIFNAAAQFYQSSLEGDKTALKILSDTRKFTIKTVREFNIGYSGAGWNQLYNHLKKSFKDADLLKSGLVVDKDGKLRDYFVPKLFVYPHQRGTRVCDFSIKDSLKHTKKDRTKVIEYRLKTENRIGNIWFYNQDALYYDDIIMVEGREDAIQLMRHLGKKNVLAITGNPSIDALNYLKYHIKDRNIYLCFDHDDAGAGYERQFFFELWGEAKAILRLAWDGECKDIDEYLRTTGKQINPKKILPEMLAKAPNMLQYLIDGASDSDVPRGCG